MNQRVDWIDSLKGMGIIMVVVGHIFDGYLHAWLYLFHMPLFFFISGYLFKPSSEGRQYFLKKSLSLLLPYLFFLVLLSAKDIVLILLEGQYFPLIKQTLKILFGGRLLVGWTGVFWFITCFFTTQQVFNLLITTFTTQIVYALTFLCLLLSYVNAIFLPTLFLPWALEVTLGAIPFFACGYYVRQVNPEIKSFLLTSFSFLGLGLSLLLIFWQPDAAYDMKRADYGIPFLSFLAALAIILALVQIAKLIRYWPQLNQSLSTIGSGSLVIMYLHQPLQLTMRNIDLLGHEWIRLILSLLISMLCYGFLMKYAVSRVLCLGSYKDLRVLTGKPS